MKNHIQARTRKMAESERQTDMVRCWNNADSKHKIKTAVEINNKQKNSVTHDVSTNIELRQTPRIGSS